MLWARARARARLRWGGLMNVCNDRDQLIAEAAAWEQEPSQANTQDAAGLARLLRRRLNPASLGAPPRLGGVLTGPAGDVLA